MPKKMEPSPMQHHQRLADRTTGRAKVVTFFKSGDKNFKGVQIPIRKKYGFSTLLSDLDRVSDFPFGVRRIVTPSATHDVTDLEDFEDGKMYIMAPTKKKPKPLDLGGIRAKPPWAHPKSLPGSGTNSAELEPLSPRKLHGNPRNAESRNQNVKKIMVMRNGDARSKHMMLLNRNRIPSFEAFLTDIGESFQLPAQKLFTSDGIKVESLSAIFNGSEELFVVGTAVEKFRPSSYKENAPFKISSRMQESIQKGSIDDSDQPPQKIVKKSRGKFRIWVSTSESPAASTDAVVSITVYGDKGKSDDIILGCGDGRFESGNQDEFNINLGIIGDIYKVRIGHDDSSDLAGWLCEEVRLQDMHLGDEIVFPCGRWMSRLEDDGQTCRELPVIMDGSPVFPIVNYYIAVVTGNYWNAGTSAKVYMTVCGERGDTGQRLLHKTKRTRKFDKGKTDVFNIEAVSLGMLRKVVINLDSTDPEDGWFLEKVIIKDHKGSSLESVFPYHDWLDATLDEEDEQNSREIFVNNKPSNLEKEMWEQEKWKFKPNNQLIFISKGSGKALQIKTDGSIEATVDPYAIQKTAIFEVRKIKANVYIVTNVANPDYCIAMDTNKISGKGKGSELKLRVQPDRSIVMETAKNSSQVLTFNQKGKPGDVRGSSLGATRQFYCYVKGMFRDEGIVMFYTSRIQTLTVTSAGRLLATGQRSDDAYWRVHKVGESGSVRMFESLAQPESFLRIKHGHCDVQGSGDNYCHLRVLRVKDKGYVILQSVASGDVCVGCVPDGNIKPTVDTGEHNVRLYPHVIQFGTKKHVTTPTPPTSSKPAVNRKKRVMNKRPSNNNPKKVAALLLTPTPTPSPPLRERSIYDETKVLDYPNPLTPTPTPCWDDDGHYEELEYPCTPILTPALTPILTPSPDEGLWDEFDTDGDWKVWVKTGRVATKATVILVVYGEDGVSQPFTLGRGGKELFKTGEENEFKVNVLSVGDIYKIRIGLDTTSKKAAWRLDQVKMKDMITEEQLVFKFKNRWLSLHEDDGDVWREAPAIRPGCKPLPVHKYSIQVTTGYEVGSSTDANVYLCLYGEKGDTGKRHLIKSNHQEKFQDSQTDMFELEAVTVMTPTKVIIGHDGKGSGAGWFVGEVIIKETKTSKMEYVFPCNRWFDEGQDDQLIERELELREVREIQSHAWQVSVTTGSDSSASTTAMVTLVAYGDKDNTEVTLIPKGMKGFQAGTTQDFRVYLGDIGQLYKIRIGHDNAARDASWYLKTVRLLDLNEFTEMEFAFDRWLSEKHDDLDVWRELPAVIAGRKPLPVTRYYIQVYIGSKESANTKASNTEASVYLQLWGKNGDSGKRHLLCSKNNKDKIFLSGQMDVFEIEAVYLGRLQKVTVGHDGKDPGQGWFLEKVVVKESKNAKNETLFLCKKWLDVGQGDQKIQRDLTLSKPTTVPNPVTSESAASRTNSIIVSWKQPTSGKVTGYRVTCDPPDALASEVIIADAKMTKAEFGGLTAGKAYQFEVVTTNGEMESDKVTLKTNAKPNPVLDAILDTTADTVVVSWSHPQGDLSGYKLRLSPSDAKRSSLRIKDPSKTRVEFVGLTPYKKYKVDITTTSGEVESEKITVQEMTKMPKIHVLKVPSAKTTKSTSDSLSISWIKPEGDVTGYRLTILPPDGASPEIKINGADKTTAEFKDLSSGQEYTLDVYTIYKDQQGEKTTLTARTDSKSNQPKDVTTTSTLTTISVSWTKPDGQVTGYRVLCMPSDDKTSEVNLDDGDTTTAEFVRLIPGWKYDLEIYAHNGNVESDKATISQTTKPNRVVDVCAESSSTDTVNLSWTKPEGNLTGYRIDYQPVSNQEASNQPDNQPVDNPDEELDKPFDEQYKPVDEQNKPVNEDGKPVDGQDKPANDQDAEVKTQTIDSCDTTNVEVTGLTPGQSYNFSIISVSNREESQPVTVSCTTMPGKILNPQFLTLDETFTCNWSPPVGVVTGYKVSCTPLSGEIEEAGCPLDIVYMKTLDLSCREISVEGLDPESEYRVTIWAVSGESEGHSVVLTTKTLSSEKPLPVLDPQTNATTDSVTIRWSPPDCQHSGYRVVCRLKFPDSQIATGNDEAKMDAHASSNPGNESSPGDETAPSGDEKLANEKPENTDQSKLDKPTPSNPSNEAPPGDETAPSSEDKMPTDSSPSTEGDKCIIEEQTVEADVTEVEFIGLTQRTEYSFDIYTVCTDVESQAVTVDEQTKKGKLPTQGEWRLWITTAEDSKPALNAQVHVVVYGNKDKTKPIMLTEDEKHSHFQAENIDEFKINVGDIGDIYKIRIGYNDDSDWQGWHLKQVKMVDEHSDEELVFDFNRWMSRQDDDFDVVRELPAVRENQEILPVNVYLVNVSTGDHWATYTDAKIWVNLIGERGDTGKRVLYHSLKHSVKFMKEQMDEFKVEAVSLGEVSMVEIGHDGVGYGAGIFINSISVRDSEGANKEYLFACNRWLDDHMEDRQTNTQLQLLGIRPIEADSKEEPSQDNAGTNWKVFIQTSDMQNAGTTANVYLTVFGETGRSQSHVLQGQTLEANTEQEFQVDIGDIGEITKIRLKHDNSGNSPAWHVQQVRLSHPTKPELIFRVNAWLSSDHGDNPSTLREVAAIRAGVDPLPVMTYIVQVYIKEDPDSATTNPNLYIALIGEAGEMTKRELNRRDQPVSEDGKVKVDNFTFEAISVGQLHRAVLSMSSDEKQDTWFVEKVTVQEGKYTTTRSVFPCKMWFGNAIIGKDGNTVWQSDLQLQGEEAVLKDNKEASNEDDGESLSEGNWTIWITPGRDNGMGSNSCLSVQVYGEKGRSEVIPLRPEGVDEANEGEDEEEDEEEKVDGEMKEGAEQPVDEGELVRKDPETKVDKDKNQETEKPAEGESLTKEPEAETEKAEEKGDGEQDLAFPPGSTKEFDMNVGEIGPIYKIRLILEAGDDKDKTPSIFLDKVKMKDKDTNQEFHFFVDRWLRCSEDVKLPPTEVSPPDAPQELEEKQEEENDKKSKDKKPEDKMESSQVRRIKNKRDEKVKARGKKKMTERINEKKKEPKEKDVVEETAEEKMQEAKTSQIDEEVTDCYLELPAIRPDRLPLPVYKYELSVRTCDKGAASFSDVIYATVYGERGDTGCRTLRKSNNRVMFNRGQVDVFSIEAVDILRPTSITIGHHSQGHGAGWCLDTVTLKQSVQDTMQYVFPCKRWMDTGVDDQKLERTLPLLGQVECPKPVTSDTKGHWQVNVETSDKPDAVTTAKVNLVVYGEKGQCSMHPLERQTFQPGTEEEFQVISVGDVGVISKIRLQHDNTGDSPSWHVNSARMKDLDTNEELYFKMNRWLARHEDNGQICHEAPAVREGIDSLQVHNYQVKVHTGDRDNATTEGAIHVTLQGLLGDSGQRLLLTSNNNPKFARGQIDTFTIQAVDLGKVHTVLVHNESPDSSQVWYLEKIIVKTSPTSEQEFVFPASRWIGQADAEIEELSTAENDVELLMQEKWKCTVYTSDLPEWGTDANVSLVAYGNSDMSKVMALINGQESNFLPGKSAEFVLEPGSYIGDIYKIRVELQDRKEKSWHLKQVDLQDCLSDESLRFEYNRWLSQSQDDGTRSIVAEMPALRPDQDPLPVVRYNLQVFTGEAEDAGTSSEVSVTLFGERGDSGRRHLNKPRDGDKAFNQPKKIDVFDLDAVSLGDISRVLVHKTVGTSWFVDRLILKAGEFANTETEFKHEGWLGNEDYPDLPVDIELVPTTVRPSNTVAQLPEGQEPVQSIGNWKVFVTTGNTETAGTEATVTMTVYGSEGTSKPLPLQQDGQLTKMEPGQTQEFEVNVGEVGHIYKVRLEHDGTNEESDWFLEKIKMKDVDTKTEFSWTASRWLSRNQQGCDRVMEIPAVWPEAPIPQVVKYEVHIVTGDEDGADTQANVYLTLKGEHGDTGRRDILRDPRETTMFSRGSEDRFTIEAVSLGRIDKCIVGYDGDKPDLGWFLDKIVVSESGKMTGETTFWCRRWLAVDKGDNTTVVELNALPPSEGAVDSKEDEGKDGER